MEGGGMKDKELEKLEALAEKATPGPWENQSNYPDHLHGSIGTRRRHIALCNYPCIQ
jgi:hypothetical protein